MTSDMDHQLSPLPWQTATHTRVEMVQDSITAREEPTPQEWLVLEVSVIVVAVSTVAMVWLNRRVLRRPVERGGMEGPVTEERAHSSAAGAGRSVT